MVETLKSVLSQGHIRTKRTHPPPPTYTHAPPPPHIHTRRNPPPPKYTHPLSPHIHPPHTCTPPHRRTHPHPPQTHTRAHLYSTSGEMVGRRPASFLLSFFYLSFFVLFCFVFCLFCFVLVFVLFSSSIHFFVSLLFPPLNQPEVVLCS